MSPTAPTPFFRPSRVPSTSRRLLCVFDGGDAPGYSSVAVALTEEGTRRGYEVWAATEGFRSLGPDATQELRFERLVVSRKERYELLGKNIPTRSMGRRLLDPGSDFRSERYLGFLRPEIRAAAVETFRAQGFTHLCCIGGNGTFEGQKAWLDSFAPGPRPTCGFVNVSIDNDLAGDRAIGFLTGVEAGATVARGLWEDGYTHKRIYLLEMMGNRSGRHALHCGVGSRAHLVVLPQFAFPEDVLEELSAALGKVEHALVVVAEGYEAARRKKEGREQSASAYLKMQLEQFGLRDEPNRRVISEPFSRYLRGVRPGFADVSAAYLKASILFDRFEEGQTEIMPFMLAAHDVGVRAFSEIARDDTIEIAFLPLLERLGLQRFRAWAKERVLSPAR